MTRNAVVTVNAVPSRLQEEWQRRCVAYAPAAHTWLPWLSGVQSGCCSRVGMLLVALLLACAGCASTRSPGEKMVRTPEETQREYSCVPSRKPVLTIEEVRVLPDVVAGGKEVEVNQRLRYAFCPSIRPETFTGNITRTVIRDGKILFRDTTNYEFKPGTWIVDAFIGIPREAKSGVYGLDIVLGYMNQKVKASSSFAVKGT
jgi:hypothetical protein